MRAFPVLCVCFALAGVQGARAASYVVTFQSGKMRPMAKGEGVKGARQITASWTIPSLPEPGKCSYYEDNSYLTSYSDGRNTLQSLLAKYEYKPNVASFLKLCLKHNGDLSQYSAIGLELVTNSGGKSYLEYVASHGESGNVNHLSVVSITTYRHSAKTKYQENDGKGGMFTLTGSN